MVMASKGHLLVKEASSAESSKIEKEKQATHFRAQIPQPIHKSSEMKATLSVTLTSMQSFPILTTGHDLRQGKRGVSQQRLTVLFQGAYFLHSC